jgi:predicted short-subunit dehydrogenase-like oxidoreductase (DUF2520 family)
MNVRIAVIGAGRLGQAFASAFLDAGLDVTGPHGRGSSGDGAEIVLLCVPDGEIPKAAALVPGERAPLAIRARPNGGARRHPAVPLVGHCSGATGLDALAGHEGFALHPLMTVTAEGATFAGAGCAVAGSSDRARSAAHALAEALHMRPVEISEEDRAAYHAAASVASNFLVTLQAAAERLGATAGLEREHLVALVRATVDNWAALGPERALTGPVARGDHQTVERQRAAIADRAPELLDLFDAMVAQTREVAAA